MKYLLKGGKVYKDNTFQDLDILVEDDRIVSISREIIPDGDSYLIDCKDKIVIPGLIDVHVHLREPGFLYKETIRTGSMAGAHGGYTTICPMPNLNPTPDSIPNLQVELDAIEKDAVIHVLPFGTITVGEKGEQLSDIRGMADMVVGYSDDGHGVQSDDLMRQAMKEIAGLGKILSAHCEVNSLSGDGYIHDGEYARLHGHKGISSESEWAEIARDVQLSKETGCRFHVCHVSTKESVDIIRKAKAQGIDVTAETGPHYLVLSEKDLIDDGRFKMNPPLRGEDDKAALIEAVLDGTIDMIATDHAPHSKEEKSKGLRGSAMGITGLETSFPVLYTELVRTGVMSLEHLIKIMHDNPAERFGIGTCLREGDRADIAVFDLTTPFIIDPQTFHSKGKATPFEGKKVYGKCKLTMADGRIVWQDNTTEK